ncbi:hypothetical protein V8G54_033510 [Vigna mungo]|uniref:Uncharacterized protein n=1 Tax=Vigna mungo TaxID=3915 RepID=A0AAQ3RIW3_VIGMU
MVLDPKKQLEAKINTTPSDSALKRLFSPNDSQGDGDAADNTDSRSDFQDATTFKGTLLAGFLLLGVIGGFASVGYIYRDQVNSFLNNLSFLLKVSFPLSFSHLIYLFLFLTRNSSLSFNHQDMALLGMHYSLPFMLDWRYQCIILHSIFIQLLTLLNPLYISTLTSIFSTLSYMLHYSVNHNNAHSLFAFKLRVFSVHVQRFL